MNCPLEKSPPKAHSKNNQYFRPHNQQKVTGLMSTKKLMPPRQQYRRIRAINHQCLTCHRFVPPHRVFDKGYKKILKNNISVNLEHLIQNISDQLSSSFDAKGASNDELSLVQQHWAEPLDNQLYISAPDDFKQTMGEYQFK